MVEFRTKLWIICITLQTGLTINIRAHRRLLLETHHHQKHIMQKEQAVILTWSAAKQSLQEWTAILIINRIILIISLIKFDKTTFSRVTSRNTAKIPSQTETLNRQRSNPTHTQITKDRTWITSSFLHL